MNIFFAEHGTKITVNLIGPLRECLNSTNDYITIDNTKLNLHQKYEIDKNEIRHLSFDIRAERKKLTNLSFFIATNQIDSIAFKLYVDTYSVETEVGVLSAAMILIFLNILIGTEILHRTIAALFTAFTSIGILAVLQDRPTPSDIASWINCETLLLIFSMMVLVAILADIGFFECIAIYAYQVKFSLKKLI